MSQTSSYTEYHPRWLRRPVSTYWWLQQRSYFIFILRELTCIFVAWFVVYLLMIVRAASESETAYQQFLIWAARPAVLTVNLVSLVFLVFHTITFFQATPQAMVVRIGRTRVPGRLVCVAHYLALVAVSIVLAWVFLRT